MPKSKKTLALKAVASANEANPSKPMATIRTTKEMIAKIAYYKAEQRGFIPGFEEQDWIEAEMELGTELSEV